MTKFFQTLFPLIAISFLFPVAIRSEVKPQQDKQSINFASATNTSYDHQEHRQKGQDHKGHDHPKIEISDGQPVPQVELITYQDTVKGWNLEIKLSNFVLTPENVNQTNELNEGHAHLFINGKKVTRIYSNWYYLQSLPQGKNSIRVVLNANNHGELTYQGEAIADTKIIEVQ